MFVKGVESGREERKTDCYCFMKEARRKLRGTFQALEYAELRISYTFFFFSVTCLSETYGRKGIVT